MRLPRVRFTLRWMMIAVTVVAMLIPLSKALLHRWQNRHFRTIVVTSKTDLLNPQLFPDGAMSFDLSKPAQKQNLERIEDRLQRRNVPYRVDWGKR